jgi:hypothetical protein
MREHFKTYITTTGNLRPAFDDDICDALDAAKGSFSIKPHDNHESGAPDPSGRTSQ